MRGINRHLDELVENRIYKAGTVDAALEDSAILLQPQNLTHMSQKPDDSSYHFERIQKERKWLHTYVNTYVKPGDGFIESITKICALTSSVEKNFPITHQPNAKAYLTPDCFFWGGTEELVMAKGSDWCHEIARLFCALAQLSGIPARMVYTFGERDGHVIAEVYGNDHWLLVDPLFGTVYQDSEGSLSAVEVYKDRNKVIRFSGGYYCDPEYFQYIAVSEYKIADAGNYDYTISFCNKYYRDRLSHIWNQDD